MHELTTLETHCTPDDKTRLTLAQAFHSSRKGLWNSSRRHLKLELGFRSVISDVASIAKSISDAGPEECPQKTRLHILMEILKFKYREGYGSSFQLVETFKPNWRDHCLHRSSHTETATIHSFGTRGKKIKPIFLASLLPVSHELDDVTSPQVLWVWPPALEEEDDQ